MEANWISQGVPLRLEGDAGVVAVEFNSEQGQAYATLRVAAAGGDGPVTQAVLGGEEVLVRTPRGMYRFEVMTIDWKARRVHVLVAPPANPR